MTKCWDTITEQKETPVNLGKVRSVVLLTINLNLWRLLPNHELYTETRIVNCLWMSTWKMYTKTRIANGTKNPYYEYYIHRQPWDFGNKVQHKILVLLVLQCQVTVGLQGQNILKLPRSSGTVELNFFFNTGRSTFEHQTHCLSAWQFNRKSNRIMLNIIMTAANVWSSCIVSDAIAWRRGLSWWQ